MGWSGGAARMLSRPGRPKRGERIQVRVWKKRMRDPHHRFPPLEVPGLHGAESEHTSPFPANSGYPDHPAVRMIPGQAPYGRSPAA